MDRLSLRKGEEGSEGFLQGRAGRARTPHLNPLPFFTRREAARLSRDAMHKLSRNFGRAHEFPIQRFVTLRGYVPRKITSHCAFHQLRPKALVAKDLTGPFHCVPEGVA